MSKPFGTMNDSDFDMFYWNCKLVAMKNKREWLRIWLAQKILGVNGKKESK